MVGVAHAFTVVFAAMSGDSSRVRPGVLETFRNGPPLPLLRALLAVLRIVRGETVQAAGVLDELRLTIDDLPVGPRWAGTLATVAAAAIFLDDIDLAQRVYRWLLPGVGQFDGDGSGVIFPTGSNARIVGELALVTGRVDSAVGLFADAVIANNRIGATPFVALSRLGWARALRCRAVDHAGAAVRSLGDLRLAGDLAHQAAAEFRRLGMPGPLHVADQFLSQLVVDIRRDDPLTGREAEIAGLIAEDLTNREIADRLVVSERTVESHVRNILAKLNLTRRIEIARWIER